MGELIKREAARDPRSFSGERLTSAVGGQVEIEHYHRYLLAREFCRGRDVLDIAAGEGYGTALLSQVASSAVGVELDQDAVDAATREFARPNLRYLQGDARAIPLPDASIDVAVTFETLEHLAEQDQFLAELRRVMRPDGLLIISTPDREVYSPIGQPPNPYHVLELTRPEFQTLLTRHFPNVVMAAQRPLIGSVILGSGDSTLRSFERRGEALLEGNDGLARAPYLVALASAAPLPPLPGSVFIHRNDLDTDMHVRLETAQKLGEAVGARDAALENMQAALGHMEAARQGEAEMTRRVLEIEQLRQDAEGRILDAEVRAARAAYAANQRDRLAAEAEQRRADTQLALEEAHRGLVEAAATIQEINGHRLSEAAAHEHALQREQSLALQLQRLQGSSAWKLTYPLRRFAIRHPGLARRARQLLKLLWWTATLQLPRRYRLWRAHRRLVLAMPALPPPEPVTLPPPPEPAPIEPPLCLPLSGEPLVSIIIPTYGQVEATLACLRAIAANPPECAIEVIVVDDAYPGPDDLAPLQRVEGIVFLRNASNLGYLRSCNRAAATARGDFIHLLNNDTEVRPGAIDALLDLLQERPDAGLVGSKLLDSEGRLQEAGGIMWDDASGWNYGRGQDPEEPQFNYLRETDYCSAASVMLRRDLWQALGGFDETFLPAYYEDADLAFRVRARGLKVLYEPRSVVVHHEGMSHGTDLATGVKAAQVDNQAKMLERWGAVLRAGHGRNGERVLRAAARALGRRTMLVIDHYVPEPDRDAGSRSIIGIMDSALDAGWLVKFWPHNRAYSGSYTTALERRGIEVLDHRWPGDLQAWMIQNGSEIDHLLAVRPDVAASVIPAVLYNTDAILSFYGVDLHFARIRRQAEHGVQGGSDPDEVARLSSLAEDMERLERRVWRNFDVVLYPSEEEAAAVRQMAPGILARGIIPFCFKAAPARTVPPAERTILFVAGFAHPPNVDAAMFLMLEVIPRLQTLVGRVKVTLAGSHPSQSVRDLAGEFVDVTGFISDETLLGLYDSHRVAVVPLRFGAGVKGKVVESLANGVPLVTTSIGAQGIEGLRDTVPVCDDALEIARALALLLTDDQAWVAQSARQVEFAGRKFSRAAMGRSVMDALQAGEDARQTAEPLRHAAQ